MPSEASRARLEALNKSNIQIEIYAGSGHALEDPPGSGTRIFRQEALQVITEFIDTVVSSGGGISQ
ncbi:MAG: hypothetical protein AB1894_09865 [Chloroflexota bacterium]